MLKVANSVISASRITGVLPVVNGGTNASTASITSFNNITGFTASGTTGTTSTKLVFDTTPTLVGDVTLSTGNLIIGTAGKGIDFSVTSSGSGTMTSELLADYEEGTWSPNQGSGLTVSGTFFSIGQYTKVGRLVTAFGYVAGTTSVAATGQTEITTNLPFTSGARSAAGSVFVTGSVPASSTCNAGAASTSVYIATTIVATTGQIYFNVTYEV
mgnify:CR=1 FL=1